MKTKSVRNKRTKLRLASTWLFSGLFFSALILSGLPSQADESDAFLQAVNHRILEKAETTFQEFLELIQDSPVDQQIHGNEKKAGQIPFDQFARKLDFLSADLYQKVQSVMKSQLDMTPSQKVALAEDLLDASFQTQFVAEKILAKVQASHAKGQCEMCKKRAWVDCRCGGEFCVKHLDEDKHHCTFDYKTFEREKIRKQNPVVIAPKVEKI